MTKLLLSTLAASFLATAAASAQSLGAYSEPPVYGSVWAAQKLAAQNQATSNHQTATQSEPARLTGEHATGSSTTDEDVSSRDRRIGSRRPVSE